jgi:CHAD domain-containing protein
MPHAPDRPKTSTKHAAQKRRSRRVQSCGGQIASPASVPFKIEARPVYSLHDAVLTLLGGAIATLRSRQDDEAVHEARKACKRIRAVLRLLRECLRPGIYRRENERVRDAAKPLTAVRDAFMLRRTFRTLPEHPAALQRGLDVQYRDERRTLTRRGARSALKRLTATREALVDLPAVGPEAMSAIAGAKRVYKAGRKALSKARDRDDEALHEWRKQAEYLLNQLALLKTVFNAKFRKLRRRADELAEALGDDHDLGVLMSKLRLFDVYDRSLISHIKSRRRKLQARAFRLGRKMYRHSPGHVEAAMAARLLKSN